MVRVQNPISILKSKDYGLRCAVIVNDMAEINIDGAVIENSHLIQREEKLIKMQNGCICCTLRKDFLEEINKLAEDGRFDYLLIESTVVSEPQQVAKTFTTDFSDSLNADDDANDGAEKLKDEESARVPGQVSQVGHVCVNGGRELILPLLQLSTILGGSL